MVLKSEAEKNEDLLPIGLITRIRNGIAEALVLDYNEKVYIKIPKDLASEIQSDQLVSLTEDLKEFAIKK